MALRQHEAVAGGVHQVLSQDSPGLPLSAEPQRSIEQDGTVDVARDRDLVERCQGGDAEAFDELYVLYRRRLHRFCVRRLGDSNEADDVVQETFARAWRALPRFTGDRRFYPWLTVIASNLCVDALRRRARLMPVEESRLRGADLGVYETEDAILQAVDSKMVAAAFGRLSERHQRVLRLREGSEWSYLQIAEYEGVGVTAIETLLWRARQALKREFLLLDGQRGKVGSLVGFLLLPPGRAAAGMWRSFRRAAAAAAHLARGLASGHVGSAGTSGIFGVFGPSAAVATGAVVFGLGAVFALPITTIPVPAPQGVSVPTSRPFVPLALPEGGAGLIRSSSMPSAGGAQLPVGPSSSGFSGSSIQQPSESGLSGSINPKGTPASALAAAASVSGQAGDALTGSGSSGTASGVGTAAGSVVGAVVTVVGSAIGSAVSSLGSPGGGTVSAVSGIVSGTGAGAAVNGVGTTVAAAAPALAPVVTPLLATAAPFGSTVSASGSGYAPTSVAGAGGRPKLGLLGF